MEIFEQDGKEVFVLTSVIDMFSVRPQYIDLVIEDFRSSANDLQNVAIASLMMRKFMEIDFAPGDEILWIADEERDVQDRILIVMEKTPNESGGYAYNAQSLRELDNIRKQKQEEGDVPGSLGELLSGLGIDPVHFPPESDELKPL